MDLDKKKKELQILKAKASKSELEYKIMEREQDIKRMKDHIKLQDEIITKLEGE